MFVRGFGQQVRCDCVVANRGDWVTFHEGDMLKRGGVDYEIGRLFVEYFFEQRSIAEIAKYGSARIAAGKRAQIGVNLLKIIFRMIEENEGVRAALYDFPGERGSERAASSRQKNTPSSDEIAHIELTAAF
jgi:hypothetical protein